MLRTKGLRKKYGFDSILQDLRDTVNIEVVNLLASDSFRRFRIIPQDDAAVQAILDELPPKPKLEDMRECLATHFLYPGSIGLASFLAFCNKEHSSEYVLWFAHFRMMEETQERSPNSVEFLNLFVEGYNLFFSLASLNGLVISTESRAKVDAMLAKVNATLATV